MGGEAPQAQEAGGNGPSVFLPSERHATQQPPSHASLMVIADAAGMVHLATYGLFVLARVSLQASTPLNSGGSQPLRVLKVSMPAAACYLTLSACLCLPLSICVP